MTSSKDQADKKGLLEYCEIILEIISPPVIWMYRYFGGEFIVRKFYPPKNSGAFPTGFIWVFGIYIASFGVASQRYENRIDIIENRANSIFAQLTVSSVARETLSRISTVQNMWCPEKPEILNPLSVIRSLFCKPVKYQEMVQLLMERLEDWKRLLKHVNLQNAILKGAHLTNADMSDADLSKADLREADLREADLKDANLQYANLGKADLRGAKLSRANLRGANFKGAFLERTHLDKTNIDETSEFEPKWLIVWKIVNSGGILKNLSRANLSEAILRYADLRQADLDDANLSKADLSYADLSEANLRGADLSEADLDDANLWRANLREADLSKAILNGVANGSLTANQLCEAKTLNEALLHKSMKDQTEEKCPELSKHARVLGR